MLQKQQLNNDINISNKAVSNINQNINNTSQQTQNQPQWQYTDDPIHARAAKQPTNTKKNIFTEQDIIKDIDNILTRANQTIAKSQQILQQNNIQNNNQQNTNSNNILQRINQLSQRVDHSIQKTINLLEKNKDKYQRTTIQQNYNSYDKSSTQGQGQNNVFQPYQNYNANSYTSQNNKKCTEPTKLEKEVITLKQQIAEQQKKIELTAKQIELTTKQNETMSKIKNTNHQNYSLCNKYNDRYQQSLYEEGAELKQKTNNLIDDLHQYKNFALLSKLEQNEQKMSNTISQKQRQLEKSNSHQQHTTTDSTTFQQNMEMLQEQKQLLKSTDFQDSNNKTIINDNIEKLEAKLFTNNKKQELQINKHNIYNDYKWHTQAQLTQMNSDLQKLKTEFSDTDNESTTTLLYQQNNNTSYDNDIQTVKYKPQYTTNNNNTVKTLPLSTKQNYNYKLHQIYETSEEDYLSNRSVKNNIKYDSNTKFNEEQSFQTPGDNYESKNFTKNLKNVSQILQNYNNNIKYQTNLNQTNLTHSQSDNSSNYHSQNKKEDNDMIKAAINQHNFISPPESSRFIHNNDSTTQKQQIQYSGQYNSGNQLEIPSSYRA